MKPTGYHRQRTQTFANYKRIDRIAKAPQLSIIEQGRAVRRFLARHGVTRCPSGIAEGAVPLRMWRGV